MLSKKIVTIRSSLSKALSIVLAEDEFDFMTSARLVNTVDGLYFTVRVGGLIHRIEEANAANISALLNKLLERNGSNKMYEIEQKLGMYVATKTTKAEGSCERCNPIFVTAL